MARKTHPLTDMQMKAAKPRDKDYSLFDGAVCIYELSQMVLKFGVLSLRAYIPKKAH